MDGFYVGQHLFKTTRRREKKMNIGQAKRDGNFDNEAMIRLAQETGSKELKDKVIENNIRLVLTLANKWKRRGSTEPIEELISTGLYKLVSCYDTFDVNRGVKFSTYAGKAIWVEFMRNVRHNQMICRSKYSAISIEENCVKGRQRSADDKTVGDSIYDVEVDEYRDADERMFAEQLEDIIDDGVFTTNERIVAKKFFIEGKEISEIGREMGVTRQAIHQTHKRNVRKLAQVVGL